MIFYKFIIVSKDNKKKKIQTIFVYSITFEVRIGLTKQV